MPNSDLCRPMALIVLPWDPEPTYFIYHNRHSLHNGYMAGTALAHPREILTHAATIVQEGGNGEQSRQKGMLLTFEELPKFLSSDGVRALENTEAYKHDGYVWFYLSTAGIRSGYYEINWKAESAREMFIPIRDAKGNTLKDGGNESQIRKAWLKRGFYNAARFFGGEEQLAVYLYRWPDVYGKRRMEGGRRLGIVGDGSPTDVAPVVVVKSEGSGHAELEQSLAKAARIRPRPLIVPA